MLQIRKRKNVKLSISSERSHFEEILFNLEFVLTYLVFERKRNLFLSYCNIHRIRPLGLPLNIYQS